MTANPFVHVSLPHDRQPIRPGGPGYILNRAALKLLMGIMDVSYYCRPDDSNHMEDVFIADCLYSIGNHVLFFIFSLV